MNSISAKNLIYKYVSLIDIFQNLFTKKTEYFENLSINPIYLKIYEIYFSKKLYNWNIFCIYFLYKNEIYSRKYIWHIFQCRQNIYFRIENLYMSHIYFVFKGDKVCKIVAFLLIDLYHEKWKISRSSVFLKYRPHCLNIWKSSIICVLRWYIYCEKLRVERDF